MSYPHITTSAKKSEAIRKYFLFSLLFHVAILLIFAIFTMFGEHNKITEMQVEVAGFAELEEAVAGFAKKDQADMQNELPQTNKTQEIKKVSEKDIHENNDITIPDTDKTELEKIEEQRLIDEEILEKKRLQLEKEQKKRLEHQKIIEEQKKKDELAKKLEKSKIEKQKKKNEKIDSDFSSILKNIQKKDSNTSLKEKSGNGGFKNGISGKSGIGKDIYSMIEAQISAHWSIPAGVKDAEKIIVEIEVSLSDTGEVIASQTHVVDVMRYRTDHVFRSAADSAMRAILRAGKLKIPKEYIAELRNFRFAFNPKNALGA